MVEPVGPGAAGRLWVVGLGPGGEGYLTREASQILQDADCLVGYDLYLALTPEPFKKGKELVASGMRREAERCNAAIDKALAGRRTVLLSSGDPGIYAMASLTLELLEKRGLLGAIDFQIVPGVPALCAAGALLGAPLGHDFACISLSDALTPWSIIQKRLLAALGADFVCVLYNPRSRARPDYLDTALEFARQKRGGKCPIGLARNVGRPGQSTAIYALADFDASLVDMLTILFIGSSESRMSDGYFITPRGYAGKRI